MNTIRVYSILTLILFVGIGSMPTLSDSKEILRLSGYGGKWFAGPQDSGYKEYDLALRNYLVQRIQKRFGVELDPKTYSGFDLLEIEALFRIKKSNEPVDLFLKMFPKNP
jgi:hypothetical protein